jgi:HAD superfamily hydrolase (TIGR01509 family)
MPPLSAIAFDLDGVLFHSEPVHCQGFQHALLSAGIHLSEDLYYQKYAGYDDREGFQKILSDFGKNFSREDIERFIEEKKRFVERNLLDIPPRPGSIPFLMESSQIYIVGLYSGSRKEEVLSLLRHHGILSCFTALVTAEDVQKTKPDPEGYLLLLSRWNEYRIQWGDPPLKPEEVVAIEDTVLGLKSARACGFFTIALLGTEEEKLLAKWAHKVLPSLEGISPSDLEGILFSE